MSICKNISTSILCFVTITFFGCSDPELDNLMDDYCNCIQKARYDQSMRYECIEKMDTIKEKYKNQPRKMQKVLDKTDECY